MRKNKKFFQEVFKFNSFEVIEDYKNLKENMVNQEFLRQKLVNQYAEVRINASRYER